MPSLRIDNAILDGESRHILLRDGYISAITEGADRPDADRVFDATGLIALPPLINSHTHVAMTLFRGNGDDLPLMEWLTTRVWPYERQMTEEDVYWGAKLGILEMIRNGTVFFNDMYWHLHGVARAVEDMGVRAMLSGVMIDIMEDGSGRRAIRERVEREYLDVRQRYSDRVQFAVGPHAIYTVSGESYEWAGEFCREHGLVLHTHLSETEKEVADCRQQHGCSPVEYLERLGCLGPNLVAAHTVWLSDDDIARLGDHRVVCAHNPVSNMKLAVNGVYPCRKLRDAGAVTALATDGAGSNNNLDLFEEMKIAALLQKFHTDDPTSLPAREVWAMVTDHPAAVFNIGGGSLQPGRLADLILVDSRRPELNPPHDVTSHLAYAACGAVVDTVICAGLILMEHRVIDGEEEIVAKANEAARRMLARVDEGAA